MKSMTSTKPRISCHRLFSGEILAHVHYQGHAVWAKGATIGEAVVALRKQVDKMKRDEQ